MDSTKLKKDDLVEVITGKDRGKTGRIIKVDRKAMRIFIQGVNMVKKAKKPKSQQDKGGIIEIEAGISASNVQMVCKKCGKTRVKFEFGKDGSKVRKCRKCGDEL